MLLWGCRFASIPTVLFGVRHGSVTMHAMAPCIPIIATGV